MAQIAWDSTAEASWPKEFEIIQIRSSIDGAEQNAYTYRSGSKSPAPLVVSLHTWSGNYTQEDPLAASMQAADFNYIRPDFRGPNNTPNSCASRLALQDIDDAISFCIENWNIDNKRIYIVGVSGGGHATSAAYFYSAHDIAAFFAWVPITDIRNWYFQSSQRGLNYADDIEKITGGSFDLAIANERSPMHMQISERSGRLHLFAGINDGYTGSVPITHSINLYNRLASPNEKISKEKTVALVSKTVEPTGEQIAERELWHYAESSRSTLSIFEGGHEMLVEFAANQIIEYAQPDI